MKHMIYQHTTMRKGHFLLSILTCLPLWGVSQSYGTLDANQIKAGFHPEGDMFWDLIGSSLFEVPQGSGNHLSSLDVLQDKIDSVRADEVSPLGSGCLDLGALSATGLGQSSPHLGWRIAPNPVHSSLQLIPPAQGHGPAFVTLHDARGRLLREETLRADQPTTWPVVQLPPGLYLLRVHTSTGAQTLRWRKQ
jgi:hypothetical protein